jgi:hypothetical protein
MKDSIYILIFTQLFLNCFLNPVFRGYALPAEEKDDMLIPLLFSQTNSGSPSNTTITDISDSESETNNESSGVLPTLVFPRSNYSYVQGFAIPKINPTVTGFPLINCSSSPSLPIGIVVNSTDCSITGKPSEATSSNNYSITASNSTGSASRSLQITVTFPTGNDDSVELSILIQGLIGGDSVIIQDIFGQNLTITENGEFDYSERHLVGNSFSFVIIQQPIGNTCSVSNPTGTVDYVNDDILINCE